jgi:DNA-binding MarR family transcriptional regulator
MQVNETSERLGELCTALVRRLRLLERTELSCCGIPMSQAMVLQTLEARPEGQKMSEIADALGVAQSTATRLVEPLVREDRVERRAAPDDGRAVIVQLTDRGRRAANELSALSNRWCQAILQRIPTDQQQSVITALETVVGAVNDCCATGCEPDGAQVQRRTSSWQQ